MLMPKPDSAIIARRDEIIACMRGIVTRDRAPRRFCKLSSRRASSGRSGIVAKGVLYQVLQELVKFRLEAVAAEHFLLPLTR